MAAPELMPRRAPPLDLMDAAAVTPSPADRHPLAPEAVSAVLARNSIASIVQKFDSGRLRTRRCRYAYAPDALYLPAWRHPKWFRRDPPVAVECHVSELEGLHEWSYVWASGVVTPLQASDDAVENEAWKVGVTHLRRVVRSFGRVVVPALPSHGIVRVDILALGGVSLHMD